nr:SEL1-like repeat protein [Rhizobium laguerreae]
MGDIYEYGQGVPIDRSKALSWFMMAASSNILKR